MKKSWPVVLFVAAGVALTFVGYEAVLLPPPETVGQVVRAAQKLNLQVLASQKGGDDVEGGVFLCEGARTWDEVNALRRNEYTSAWAGVVSVQSGAVSATWEEGPQCKRLGGVVLFGDPDLLRRISRLFYDG